MGSSAKMNEGASYVVQCRGLGCDTTAMCCLQLPFSMFSMPCPPLRFENVDEERVSSHDGGTSSPPSHFIATPLSFYYLLFLPFFVRRQHHPTPSNTFKVPDRCTFIQLLPSRLLTLTPLITSSHHPRVTPLLVTICAP